MTIHELRDWFAATLAEPHGCRWDGRGKETRAPCGHCQKTADLLADAWRARFVTEE